MSSCLSGGATYTFELKMMKSAPPRAASSHNTPSPSSTISESNSPPFTISTRRPRTRRKRPNQTYNEAAALLSTAYPNIFSSKRNTPFLGIKSPLNDYDEASRLLLPFETIEEETAFLFNPTIQTKPYQFLEKKEVSVDSEVNRFELLDDFDAESIILDEEIEQGIDSFMGSNESNDGECTTMPWYGSSIGSGSGNFRFGLRSSLREYDDDEDASLCRYPTVELEHISPRFQTTAALADDGKSDATVAVVKKKRTKKRKKKKVAAAEESKSVKDLETEKRVSLFLKLDYDRVLEAWSDKESPFSDEILGSHATGIDIHVRILAEIDLFGESGMREASVLRYKEKRRSRLFSNSKQIRYQVRKLSADQRPRMKGRFVRRPNILSGLRL
ncbi:hypothetical protein Bca52824_070247 [Brassica carinata]|uniref:CCT domain-containing protein n=1 Tax=Brassica carinata TaxID=52824 RepID=A0A8X7Q521_BRACI|nr:hypothetical protein Bca52824_070247 [Brassica carinata]